MKKIIGMAAALLLAGLLAGCGGKEAAASAEDTARAALQAVYSCTAEDAADWEAVMTSATSETALTDYWTERMGESFTGKGIDGMLANRVGTRVMTTWPDTAVTAGEITLQEKGSATDTEQWYSYTVEAAPEGEDAKAFTGDIGLLCTDGVWQVDSIS